MNYIGFENLLNVSNPSSGDVYDFMAGGLFDYRYAANFGYGIGEVPQPDLRSIFLDIGSDLTAGLFGLNEDFTEYALMPMLIITTNYESEYAIKSIISSVNEFANIKIRNPKLHLGGANKNHLDGNAYANFNDDVKTSYKGLAEFFSELKNDDLVENTLEKLGHMYGGAIGAALAGMVYDGIKSGRISGTNIAEAVYGEFKSLAMNTAISSGIKALGTSISPIGAGLLIGAITAAIDEAFEVAVGLDRHYGFGGELNAMVGQNSFYDRDFSFTEGIRNLFGILDSAPITQVDKTGKKMMGLRLGKEIYGYVKNENLVGNLSYNLQNINPQQARYDDKVRQNFDNIKSKDWTMSNFKMDSFGNVSFGINIRDNLKTTGIGAYTAALDQNLKDMVMSDLKTNITPTFATLQTVMGVVTVSIVTNVSANLSNNTSNTQREIFSRDKNGNFSFSNTQAGNMVEAMGMVGFGKGSLSVSDIAKSMQMANRLKEQKDTALSKNGSNGNRDNSTRGGSYKSEKGFTGFGPSSGSEGSKGHTNNKNSNKNTSSHSRGGQTTSSSTGGGSHNKS